MDDLSKKEIGEFMCSRAEIYRFLSRAYREEIDQVILEEIEKKPVGIEIECSEISKGYETLKMFVKQSRGQSILEKLEIEYASIFLGYGTSSTHPYESVYLNSQELVMQEQRNLVSAFYRKFGFIKIAEFKEPEDHIAIELDFMSRLCEETIGALKDGHKKDALMFLEAQNSFLTDHLKPWVPQFCDDLVRSACLNFYEAIGKITKGFLSLEEGSILILINKLS